MQAELSFQALLTCVSQEPGSTGCLGTAAGSVAVPGAPAAAVPRGGSSTALDCRSLFLPSPVANGDMSHLWS